jgi:hypothetical protein
VSSRLTTRPDTSALQASDPRIQSAICDSLELRHGLRQVTHDAAEGEAAEVCV